MIGDDKRDPRSEHAAPRWAQRSTTVGEVWSAATRSPVLSVHEAAFTVGTHSSTTDRPASRTAIDELAQYFSGELEAAMGHRSSQGPQIEALLLGYSPRTGAAHPEPGPQALEAARAMRRLEQALERLTRPQRIVLAAFHAPLPPRAPWGLRDALGPYAAVAVAVGELGMLGGGIGRAVDGEVARLRRVVAMASRRGPWRAGARRWLEEVRARSLRAAREAEGEYEAAHADVQEGARRDRKRRRANLRELALETLMEVAP